MQQQNVKFLHLRAKRNGTLQNKGGCTIAFEKHGNEVKMALSVCNTAQRYNPALGEKVARERLLYGKPLSLTEEEFVQSVHNLNDKVCIGVPTPIDMTLIKE